MNVIGEACCSAPRSAWIIRFAPPCDQMVPRNNHLKSSTYQGHDIFYWSCPDWIEGSLFRQLCVVIIQTFVEMDRDTLCSIITHPERVVELLVKLQEFRNSGNASELSQVETELLSANHYCIQLGVENECLKHVDILVTDDFDPGFVLRNILYVQRKGQTQSEPKSPPSFLLEQHLPLVPTAPEENVVNLNQEAEVSSARAFGIDDNSDEERADHSATATSKRHLNDNSLTRLRTETLRYGSGRPDSLVGPPGHHQRPTNDEQVPLKRSYSLDPSPEEACKRPRRSGEGGQYGSYPGVTSTGASTRLSHEMHPSLVHGVNSWRADGSYWVQSPSPVTPEAASLPSPPFSSPEMSYSLNTSIPYSHNHLLPRRHSHDGAISRGTPLNWRTSHLASESVSSNVTSPQSITSCTQAGSGTRRLTRTTDTLPVSRLHAVDTSRKPSCSPVLRLDAMETPSPPCVLHHTCRSCQNSTAPRLTHSELDFPPSVSRVTSHYISDSTLDPRHYPVMDTPPVSPHVHFTSSDVRPLNSPTTGKHTAHGTGASSTDTEQLLCKATVKVERNPSDVFRNTCELSSADRDYEQRKSGSETNAIKSPEYVEGGADLNTEGDKSDHDDSTDDSPDDDDDDANCDDRENKEKNNNSEHADSLVNDTSESTNDDEEFGRVLDDRDRSDTKMNTSNSNCLKSQSRSPKSNAASRNPFIFFPIHGFTKASFKPPPVLEERAERSPRFKGTLPIHGLTIRQFPSSPASDNGQTYDTTRRGDGGSAETRGLQTEEKENYEHDSLSDWEDAEEHASSPESEHWYDATDDAIDNAKTTDLPHFSLEGRYEVMTMIALTCTYITQAFCVLTIIAALGVSPRK